jgi:hypothetical protein
MRRDQEGRQYQGLRTDAGEPAGGFHMFDPVKAALRGRRFSSDEEVIGAVQNWLKTNQKTHF